MAFLEADRDGDGLRYHYYLFLLLLLVLLWLLLSSLIIVVIFSVILNFWVLAAALRRLRLAWHQRRLAQVDYNYYSNYNILYYTTLYFTRLSYNILCCTILYYTILYYTILYYSRVSKKSGRRTSRKGGRYGWKPSSSSNVSIWACRAYPLIEIRQHGSCRAIRGDGMSVNSTLPALLASRNARWAKRDDRQWYK